jgi:hypothetical protein
VWLSFSLSLFIYSLLCPWLRPNSACVYSIGRLQAEPALATEWAEMALVVGHGSRDGDGWASVMSSVWVWGWEWRSVQGGFMRQKKQEIMLVPFSTYFLFWFSTDPADPWIIMELLTASLFVSFVVRMPKPYPSLWKKNARDRERHGKYGRDILQFF